MIEMSVDKETVLPQDGRAQPSIHTPPPLSECTRTCNNAPKAAGAAVATSANSDGPPTCVGAAFAGSVVLAEQPTHTANLASRGSQAESVGQEARTDGNPPRPKNGLQQPPQKQPPQPQQLRLNKRRNTMSMGFKHPGSGKRRRRANSESDPVLPTNFLLGGNIFDPLNLNSLLDEEVNRAINAETPKSSPLPAKSRDPVEILIPRDITDPLNLNSSGADACILVSPLRTGGRRRHRNRHHGGGGAAAAMQIDTSESERGKASEQCAVATAGGALPLAPPSASGAAGAIPEAPREGAVLLDPKLVQQSLCPSDMNTSSSCRDEAAPSALPKGSTSQPPARVSADPRPAGPPPAPATPRQRKRRRASSRSEFVPGAPGKGQGHPQVLPGQVGGGASGQPQLQNRRRQQQQQQQTKFQYGNYNKYYGYRNPGRSEDPRLRVMRPEWFRGKDVLDLGCNTGHLTLSIAQNWRPARIVGLDIDGGLVHAARQNVRHYLSDLQAQEARRAPGRTPGGDGADGQEARRKEAGEERVARGGSCGAGEETQRPEGGGDKMDDGREMRRKQGEEVPVEMEAVPVETEESRCAEEGHGANRTAEVESPADSRPPPVGSNGESHPFPVSLRISRGPIAAPPLPDTPPLPLGDFPANVSFVKGNYVLQSDALLQTQQPEYDVILCLSVTKWVHLNWGDEGLQRLFRRVYRHLRPGGLFILEPQSWASYSKRKKLTDTIYKNYYNIRFKPDQFSSYLTSEVGFSGYELIGTPNSSSRGFQRPIYLFRKGPSCSRK
ncbi:7SK snRNA methylphosphate capping enzyme [Megalops cyprinoides]|uniref:7SK snRNA methylphosphate capping enzyme n=1 Tax=Megalops cyprinoides TaxID=118141 RepID=UPI0018643281|nr:7SK snRNA methylphosphate capping enzyme [Megalops cyprinoides]XP_036381090.1 7SK snRNA methylphosphate capping enzyme [Megalops cyprinoides]XP_036381091.1 7SK snRNA methylphosphate capping enzyme [Megalops cyprinoides]XP_036381092.1 7SK snRNA methylphosphate capping enzyme [Megalops cyprinoides]XP_036381093.1 7SK snRNA methylphosphate capping enzyme [Megalops cyprinoides]